MSSRFKFPDMVKEKLTGSRLTDRNRQICKKAQLKQDSRKSILYDLYCKGLSKKEVHTRMNINSLSNKNYTQEAEGYKLGAGYITPKKLPWWKGLLRWLFHRKIVFGKAEVYIGESALKNWEED